MLTLHSIFIRNTVRKTLFYSLTVQRRYSDKHRNIVLDYWRERIGNREIVGYGFNGQPCYHDTPAFPFPAIRFGEPTAEIVALRQREKGDWRLLTIEDKKKLYRYSYCQTFAEFNAFGTKWMYYIGMALIYASIGGWLYIFNRLFTYEELPDSFLPSSKMDQMARMLDLHVNEITGLSSQYDYEKKVWKKQPWFYTRPNPFEEDKCFQYGDSKQDAVEE